MKARSLGAVAALLFPAVALAQSSRPATYITAEQVKLVNALPGVDRQIVNVDVGNTNLAHLRRVAPQRAVVRPRPRPSLLPSRAARRARSLRDRRRVSGTRDRPKRI
jgi:hypothetical protein